ncbi:ATP-binding protein [Streptomyces sp. NPDC050658]|uniref:ATP-binding protein n=1 Tax=unclassified Streptomyces TaxID=2593676 RepID=UPI00341309BB
MSLPLTRRIARAALLIAAGAAPVVGAAGSASAAELPATPDLGGVTALDGAGLGNTVDGAAQNVTGLAGETGSKAVKKAVPAAGKTVGSGAKTTTPAAQKAAGGVAGSAGEVLGETAGTATEGALPTDDLGGSLPTDAVTKGGLPTDQLPVKGLPLG